MTSGESLFLAASSIDLYFICIAACSCYEQLLAESHVILEKLEYSCLGYFIPSNLNFHIIILLSFTVCVGSYIL